MNSKPRSQNEILVPFRTVLENFRRAPCHFHRGVPGRGGLLFSALYFKSSGPVLSPGRSIFGVLGQYTLLLQCLSSLRLLNEYQQWTRFPSGVESEYS